MTSRSGHPGWTLDLTRVVISSTNAGGYTALRAATNTTKFQTEGHPGHVTFYIGIPDVEAAPAKTESLCGSRIMDLETVMDQVEIVLFNDPEVHQVGVVKAS